MIPKNSFPREPLTIETQRLAVDVVAPVVGLTPDVASILVFHLHGYEFLRRDLVGEGRPRAGGTIVSSGSVGIELVGLGGLFAVEGELTGPQTHQFVSTSSTGIIIVTAAGGNTQCCDTCKC